MSQPLSDVDLVVLDIDGVIVDVSNSYRKAILETLKHELDESVPKSAIQLLKNAGGFNNDWNVTYALAFFVLAKEQGMELKLEDWAKQIESRGGGLDSAKAIIDDNLETIPLGKVYEQWDPDRLRDVFQHFYLGAELYERIEPGSPTMDTSGFILSEPVIIDASTISHVRENHQLGILTGRPSMEAKIALKRANIDLPDDRVLTMDDWAFQKPHPNGLMKIADQVGASKVVFVGDTLDDVKTAVNATDQSDDTSFFGVGVLTGGLTGESGRERYNEAGATMVLSDVNELPEVLS